MGRLIVRVSAPIGASKGALRARVRRDSLACLGVAAAAAAVPHRETLFYTRPRCGLVAAREARLECEPSSPPTPLSISTLLFSTVGGGVRLLYTASDLRAMRNMPRPFTERRVCVAIIDRTLRSVPDLPMAIYHRARAVAWTPELHVFLCGRDTRRGVRELLLHFCRQLGAGGGSAFVRGIGPYAPLCLPNPSVT